MLCNDLFQAATTNSRGAERTATTSYTQTGIVNKTKFTLPSCSLSSINWRTISFTCSCSLSVNVRMSSTLDPFQMWRQNLWTGGQDKRKSPRCNEVYYHAKSNPLFCPPVQRHSRQLKGVYCGGVRLSSLWINKLSKSGGFFCISSRSPSVRNPSRNWSSTTFLLSIRKWHMIHCAIFSLFATCI